MDGEGQKWIKHYCSSHKILLVGEGDFSFSVCLAKAFGSAANMVATSLDSTETLKVKYSEASDNLKKLEELGCGLIHQVDANNMNLHPLLSSKLFDRIVFNFPHAGFHHIFREHDDDRIRKHKGLVHGFLRNASAMLRVNGEIHVNHKTTAPFCDWNLEEIASRSSLALTKCVDFKREDYPGYNNKRGAGLRCDEPFPLGKCSTFKFRFSRAAAKNLFKRRSCMNSVCRCEPRQEICYVGMKEHREILSPVQQQPTPVNFTYPGMDVVANTSRTVQENVNLPFHVSIQKQNASSGSFGGYFSYVVEPFGRTDYNVGYCVQEALKPGFERYMAEAPGRTLNGYVYVLPELHPLRNLGSPWLGRMSPDQQYYP